MNTRLLLAIAAVSAVQLATPAWMIASRELTLREGTAYKFRTAPVDPYDAFRGRYVAISVGATDVAWADRSALPTRSETAFVSIRAGEDGYAILGPASRRPPESGDYIRAEVRRAYEKDGVTVDSPVDRYYLPDDEAPAAERAYWDNSRTSERNAEVVVRVRRGDLVVEALLVDGMPIREWVAEHAEEEPR